MIPEAQLEWMREVSAGALNRTCTLKLSGTPSQNRGQFAQPETDAATDVKGSWKPATGDERVVGGAQVPVGSYVATFEYGVTVTSDMRAVFDATDDEPEKSFSLVAPLDASRTIAQQWLATSP